MFITIGKKNIITAFSLALAGIILACALGVTSTATVFFGKSSRKIPVYGVEVEGEKR